MSLKVAIVHYHLKPGGVTRVIENTAAALELKGIHPAVLYGAPKKGTASPGARFVEGLGYSGSSSMRRPENLYENLIKAARDELGGPPDLWHIHNHSLGKNPALTAACCLLVENGHRLLLQIHDFPEDGRPANYQELIASLANWREAPEKVLYPAATQVHYGVLNPRDARILRDGGFARDRLHILPNPVSFPGTPSDVEKELLPKQKGERLTLYPTRGIRRKNLGEFLLWASLAANGERFATTLAPDNPIWSPRHDRWVRFSQEMGLPADFAVINCYGGSFPGWLKTADRLITTSVAEGFGMAFLEPFLLPKPLVGRNLPQITPDFGIDLSNLYNRLEIPLDLVGEQRIRERLKAAMETYYASYGRPVPDSAVDQAMNSILKDGRVDFGRLDEPLQEKVIKALAGSPQLRADLRPDELSTVNNERILSENRLIVLENYSLNSYGTRLEKIYETLCGEDLEKPDFMNPGRILNGFLRPETFSLLRS